MAALVMGAAAAATGELVLMFFQPGAAKALVKGELEKFQGLKGQPDPIMLYESIEILDGRIILCELGLPICDIKEEDLREGVELMMASSFLFEAEGANMVFSY
jgi:predicted peroxiredoxin